MRQRGVISQALVFEMLQHQLLTLIKCEHMCVHVLCVCVNIFP